MNRRDFLKALSFTALAPFIPAIEASPKLDQLPFGEVLSGKYPLFLSVGNESGRISSISRQPVVFAVSGYGKFNSEQINFGTATESCVIDRAFLENEDGSIAIPIDIKFNAPLTISPGGELHVFSSLTADT